MPRSFTFDLLFKHNNVEMVIHYPLAKIRPSSLKIHRMHLSLGTKVHFFYPVEIQ